MPEQNDNMQQLRDMLSTFADLIREGEGTDQPVPVSEMRTRLAAIDIATFDIQDDVMKGYTRKNGSTDPSIPEDTLDYYRKLLTNFANKVRIGTEKLNVDQIEAKENQVCGIHVEDYIYRLRIPDSVKEINDEACFCDDFIRDLDLGNGVEKIGAKAFDSCRSLKTIKFSNKLTNIGEKAFYFCYGLKSIILPESVTTIEKSAFGDNGYLSIYIPASVTSIGAGAFDSAKSITIDPANPVFDSRDNCNAVIRTATNTLHSACDTSTIPSSVTAIASDAFYGVHRIGSAGTLVIPDTIKVIEDYALRNCTIDGLTLPFLGRTEQDVSNRTLKRLFGNSEKDIPYTLEHVTLTDKTKSIGSYAFSNCPIKTISLPSSLQSIGDSAFLGSQLESITIPDSVTSIGWWAFSSCPNLRSLNMGKCTASLTDNPFCRLSLSSIVVDPENTEYDSRDNCNAIIETSSNSLILGCPSTIIPDSVTSIGSNAFGTCPITSITIPNSVAIIDSYAFSECESLTSVTLYNASDSLEVIGEGAFSRCTKLTSINIPNTIKRIDYQAFAECSSLTSITIPGTIEVLGEAVFYECPHLTNIHFDGHVDDCSNFDWPTILSPSMLYTVDTIHCNDGDYEIPHGSGSGSGSGSGD